MASERHHNHIQLDCPNCGHVGEAVGRPRDLSWYCFNCHARGHYEQKVIVEHVPGSPDNEPTPVGPTDTA
jgi:hypothetical protein